MRHILLLLMAGLFLGGCTSVPNQDELLSEPVIYTARDKGADFSSYLTYYVSDTMALVDGLSKDSFLTNSEVTQFMNQLKQHMNERGFQFKNLSIASKPDLGIMVTLIRNQTETYTYGGWWYYGWYPYYWYYPPYYPYYPYTVTVPTNQGTIVIDIMDLKNAATTEKYQVMWTGVLSGYLSGNHDVNVQMAGEALDQAFVQSPYLKH